MSLLGKALLVTPKYATIGGTETLTNKTLTDPTAALTYDKITGYGQNYTTVVAPATSQSLFHSPMASQVWHDAFAFGRAFGYPTFEVSGDGVTWTTETLDKRLFAQKDNQNNLHIDGTTVRFVKFTWTGVPLTGNLPMWLQIDYGATPGFPASKTVSVVKTPDNFNYYERHRSTYSHIAQSVFHYIEPMYATNTLQIKITSNSGDPVDISAIKLLVAKTTNNNDGSKRYEYPYEWDELGGITVKSSLSIINSAHSSFSGPSVKLIASEFVSTSYTLTLPESSGTTDRLISRTSTDTLSNKTLTAPIINSGLTLRGTLTVDDIFGNPSTGGPGLVLTSTGTGVMWATPNSARTPFSLQIGAGFLNEGSSYDGSAQVSIALNQNYVGNLISGLETTLRNKTLEYPKITGRIRAGDTWGDFGQVLTSTGYGIKWEKPGSTFDFGNLTGTFTDPISYLLDKVGMDFGTFTQPNNLSVDLGTI